MCITTAISVSPYFNESTAIKLARYQKTLLKYVISMMPLIPLEKWRKYYPVRFYKHATRQVTAKKVEWDNVALIYALDEKLAYKSNKNNRHYLFYAFYLKSKIFILYTFSPRSDVTCRKLLTLFALFHLS